MVKKHNMILINKLNILIFGKSVKLWTEMI